MLLELQGDHILLTETILSHSHNYQLYLVISIALDQKIQSMIAPMCTVILLALLQSLAHLKVLLASSVMVSVAHSYVHMYVMLMLFNFLENIRLTGGSSPYEGRVEVFLNGQWGTVCSTEEATTAEAATLCNSLGFGPPQSVVGGALYGDSTDIPILVNKLVCQGTQDHFSQCRVIMNQLSSCTHENDIGLICSRKHCALINITLIPVFVFCAAPIRFFEDNIRSPWEGEIEVYYGGQWDSVCNADWDINDANVVCRELGFSGASSAEYSRATTGRQADVILDGALCVGTEDHLLDCPRIVSLSNVTRNCLGNYAGVTCIGKQYVMRNGSIDA